MTRLRSSACLSLLLGIALSPARARAQAADAAPPAVPPPPPAAAPTAPAAESAPAPAPAPAQMTLVPPGRKIDLSTPPPSVSVPRSYHMHDGFYLRASVGFGSLGATFDDNSTTGQDLKGSGGALALDLMIGGSPAPGVAVGGALLGEGSAGVEMDRGSFGSEDRSLSLGIIGPFIDGFPSANRGWHLGGMMGLARLSVEDTSSDGLSKTNGFGGAFWIGHDFWVADEWSVGPLLRFSGALTSGNDPDVHASTFAMTLLFTGLYH